MDFDKKICKCSKTQAKQKRDREGHSGSFIKLSSGPQAFLPDSEGLDGSQKCPQQLHIMGFKAGLPGFLRSQLGCQGRSVARCLLGWFFWPAWWLWTSVFSACLTVPLSARTKGWSLMLGSRHGDSPIWNRPQGWMCVPFFRLGVSVSQCLLVYCAMKWMECVLLCKQSNANALPGKGKTYSVKAGSVAEWIQCSVACHTRHNILILFSAVSAHMKINKQAELCPAKSKAVHLNSVHPLVKFSRFRANNCTRLELVIEEDEEMNGNRRKHMRPFLTEHFLRIFSYFMS